MKQEQIKKHFAMQADEYEILMVKLIPQYLYQHQIIYNLLPANNKKYKVLDLGCGNGVLSEVVLKKMPLSYIVAFDLTEKMLQAYEKKLSKYRDQFELKMGDYRTDTIGDNYDIILAGLTLHHLSWEERKQFDKILYNSLKPGGLFIARDIIIDEDEEIRKYQYELWKKFMQSKGEDPQFWYEKHIEKDHPITLAQHFTWLKEAGFIRTACHWRLFNFVITSAEKG